MCRTACPTLSAASWAVKFASSLTLSAIRIVFPAIVYLNPAPITKLQVFHNFNYGLLAIDLKPVLYFSPAFLVRLGRLDIPRRDLTAFVQLEEDLKMKETSAKLRDSQAGNSPVISAHEKIFQNPARPFRHPRSA